MTKFITIILPVAAAFLFAGCAGSSMQSTSAGNIPKWYKQPPQDPNHLRAAYTATSQDMQLAVDKAVTGARTEIGRQVEVKIQGLQKKFEEEVGGGANAELLQQFTSTSKTIVSTVLSGSRVEKQEQFQDGQMWRAYVLVQYPLGAANEALMQSIKSNEALYTRFRSSQAFKDLDDEVKKYEDFKAKDAAP